MTPEELTRFTALEARFAALEARCAMLELSKIQDTEIKIKDSKRGRLTKLVVATCLRVVSEDLDVSMAEIIGKCKIYKTAWARHVFRAMLYEYGSGNLSETNRICKGSWGSVQHSLKTVANLCEQNQKHKDQVTIIRAKLDALLSREKTQ